MKKKLHYSLILFFIFCSAFSNPSKSTELLTCAAPTALTSSNVTFNSVVLTWVENGTATAWDIIILPTGSPAPSAASVPTVNDLTFLPFTLTGLTSGTNYDIYVRSDCGGGESSPWSGSTTISTPPAPPVCGGNYVDSGGINANYSNNANSTVTICPTNPGDIVNVTFISFNTEALHDAMYVYDGVNVTPTALLASSNGAGNVPGGLAGGYWGNTIPGPFTASNATGCLTFRFVSNISNTAPGWVANVTCGPAVCNTPTASVVTNITNTTAVINWSSSGANAFEYLILPFGSPEPTGIGIPVFSTPLVVNNLSPDICYTAYIRSVCSPEMHSEWSSVDFCMFDCQNSGECPESLTLVAFLDANNNGTKESSENVFSYGNFAYQVNSGSAMYGSSNSGAFSIFENNPANLYSMSFQVSPYLSSYYSSTATFSNINVPTGSGSNIYYFPVTQLQEYNDLEVQIIPYVPPRPGFLYSNTIIYKNNGTENIPSGTIYFTKSPAVAIYAISQTGTTPQPSGFSYNFTNLAPNESRAITVTMQVPVIPIVNLNDILINSVLAQTNSTDAVFSNNSASLSQLILGSYDPNDKVESHGGKIVHSTFTSNDYLYYTIQFENTGTANAEFIRVVDALDPKLDESTFEMLNASHNVNTKRDGNGLTWHFYGIDLPPTSANPSASHGFVQFRIKPKAGYVVGDVIPNYASIYFDFNPPIITDTFTTEFVQSMGNSAFDTTTISLYPNPSSDIVTISNSSAEKISRIDIYDVSGKKIYTLKENIQDAVTIDVSHFAKGIYLVELTSDTNSKTTKKLLLK